MLFLSTFDDGPQRRLQFCSTMQLLPSFFYPLSSFFQGLSKIAFHDCKEKRTADPGEQNKSFHQAELRATAEHSDGTAGNYLALHFVSFYVLPPPAPLQ